MRSFGTVLHDTPACPTPLASKRVLDRFLDVAAFTHQQMPQVHVGGRYRLNDAGDEAIALCLHNGFVALYCPTASLVTWVQRRALDAHFTHLGDADPATVALGALAQRMAQSVGRDLIAADIEAATVLTDVLGDETAHHYLDDLLDAAEELTDTHAWDIDFLRVDTRLYLDEMHATEADEA